MPDEPLDLVQSDVKLGFFMIKNIIIESYDLTLGAFWLYSCLSKFSWGKGSCFPSTKTLAKITRAGPKESGVSEQAIRNWTDELISKKLITVNEQVGKGKVYTLLEVADLVTPQPALTPQPELTGQPGFAEPLNQGLKDPSTRVEQKNNKLRRRKEEDKESVFVLPDWVPIEPWERFDSMRMTMIRLRIPWSNSTRLVTVKKLLKLKDEGYDPGEVLDQSVERGYRGIFPVSQNNNRGNGNGRFLSKAEITKQSNERVYADAFAREDSKVARNIFGELPPAGRTDAS